MIMIWYVLCLVTIFYINFIDALWFWKSSNQDKINQDHDIWFQSNKSAILVLNALDVQGYHHAMDCIKLIDRNIPMISSIYMFYREYDDKIKPYRRSNRLHIQYIPLNATILYDQRIGKVYKPIQYTLFIIESWTYMTKLSISHDMMIISLSYDQATKPIFTPSFHKLFDTLYPSIPIDMILLGKTKRLTSESDWHDIAVAAFRPNSSNFQSWLHNFYIIYSYYSTNRTAFIMLDPRPAILEATSSTMMLNIQYFSQNDTCSVPSLSISSSKSSKLHDHHKHHDYHRSHSSLCSIPYDPRHNSKLNKKQILPSSYSPIQMQCGSSTYNVTDTCMILELPSYWKSVDKEVAKTFKREGQAKKDPVHLLWMGGLRLRNATKGVPRPFCWEKSSNQQEILSRSHIEYGPTRSEPYNHSNYDIYRKSTSKIKAVIMSGSDASGNSLDFRKYLTISKMYYAKRHGYGFDYITSNEVGEYLPHDLFSDAMGVYATSSYFRGVMTKPLMMLDVMYRHLDQEWLVWTDDDVYINPGWLYLPLDVFLGDVPPHKVMVMSNYRSAFTNILFIRNNAQGRRLMMDWIAIVMSGYIQCHGYDQAAIEVLIAQRLSYDDTFSTTKPLNFTCLYQKGGKLGCDGGADWSCDFKFEKALYDAGYKTKKIDFHGGKISSFSKGCANNIIPDFHVITETQQRPRVQCGLCTRENEVESSGDWDGPLGGGNLPILSGNINGYFFNHKLDMLFYELYLQPQGCMYLADVVPACDIIHDHMVSLTDGYAFDLNIGSYCKLPSNSDMSLQQHQDTYMSSYGRYIHMINQISDDEWSRRYKDHEGGYGRSPCRGEKKKDCNEDGQRKRQKTESLYERENYCETCRQVPSTSVSMLDRMVVDCRSGREEEIEFKTHVNT